MKHEIDVAPFYVGQAISVVSDTDDGRTITLCHDTIVDAEPNVSFEFIAEGYSTWRYEFAERDGATVVTESFSFPPFGGWQKLVYGRLLNRQKAITKGIQSTLDRLKQSLER